MGLFDFFRRKQSGQAKIETEKPSIEQKVFATAVMEIITPSVERFGFKHDKTIIKTYSTNIVWRKDQLYIRVSSTNYPTDYPYYYNIILGEGSSDDFFEYDWNSIAIWALANLVEPINRINSYDFPPDDKINESLNMANTHLIQYGQTFLAGDLSIFHQARKLINEKREPYKISTPDQNGKYHTRYEPNSVKQKKKYS